MDKILGYMAINGYSYLQPIVDLFSKVMEIPKEEGQPSEAENGYSVSIILLSVVMLETFIGQARYCLSDEDISNEIRKNREALKVFEYLIEGKDFKEATFEETSELFILRDIIAHSYQWDCEIGTDLEGNYIFSKDPSKVDLFGNNQRYRKYVDEKSRKTENLHLNVLPTFINREDAITVFTQCIEKIKTLQMLGLRGYDIAHKSIYLHDKSSSIFRLIEWLKGKQKQS